MLKLSIFTALTITALSQFQPIVQCDGPHALCIFTTCDTDGNCDCKIFDGVYQIATNAIQDSAIQQQTQSTCTISTPCEVNEAPICDALLNDQYSVDGELVSIISTYSWNAFCERAWPPESWTICPDTDSWASCMMAPCEDLEGTGEFAVCRCTVNTGSYIDNDDQAQCNYPAQVIKASVPGGFDFGVFDGEEYVFQACAEGQFGVGNQNQNQNRQRRQRGFNE